MKIEGILQRDDYFYVTVKCNWWDRIWGYEDTVEKYKQIGKINELAHGCVYIDKDGNKLSPLDPTGKAIDQFKLKRIFLEEEMNLNMN